MQPTTRVFISATSADLASYRQVVKDALITNGILPIEQTNFPPDYRSVEAMLEEKIAGCDAVICLIGFVFGAEPSARPADQPRRSYTQMEFQIARRLGKPIYRFLAAEQCQFDARPSEDAERNNLQLAHRNAIQSADELWELFSEREQLRRRVAHIQFSRRVANGLHPQNLPYVSLGRLFKGRQSFLEEIRDHLLAQNHAGNGAHTAGQRQVLWGLGGIGKTRLAVEYGWRYRDEYCALLFVVADSPENLRRNLAQLTGPLVLNLPEQNRQDEEVKMAAALRWLIEHPGWFLILDNVDDRNSAQAVDELLARIPGGHVLITSRLGDWSKDVESLELDVLSAADSKDFLLERTQRRRITANDSTDAALLAKELDGLALALEQAGAFIERQRCSLADYMKRWKAGENRVLQWFDSRVMHYPRSVAIAYETTMREVGTAAAEFFRLLSWFASDPLPLGVVETIVSSGILANLPDVSAEASPEEAIAELAAFSMIKRCDVDGMPCLVQHRLVRELTQRQIPERSRQPSLRAAVELLMSFAPKDAYRPEVWREWKTLVPHAEALWEKVKLFSHDRWNTALMDGLALYYLGQGRATEALPIQEEVVKLKEQRLGRDAVETLLAKNDLALLLNHSGQPDVAEPLYREALAGREALRGAESEDAAETLHNLGLNLLDLAKPEEGVSLLRKSLEIFKKTSGENHWRTLMAEYSLAKALLETGDAENGVSLLRANLEKKSRHLSGGELHPDTLDTVQTLADARFSQGDLVEAEQFAKRAVAGREKALGKDDRHTLYSLGTLRLVYRRQNKLPEAAEVQHQLVESVLRFGNPAGLRSVRQLAWEHFMNGEYVAAEQLLRRLLEKKFEVPGNHCHLARVLLLTDRELEARDQIGKAWMSRSDGPLYVTSRILFLRVLFACLDRSPLAESVAHLKFLFQKPEVFTEWKMQPVLEHLKARFPESDFAFLSALGAALGDESKIQGLDSFAVWRETQPKPIN